MHKIKRGFTLIELSLSIAFIGVLSIILVVIIVNAINTYHRGIVLNQINTVGMDLVDNMREAVQSSPGKSLESECSLTYSDGSALDSCMDTRNDGKNAGLSFVALERYADVQIGRDTVNVPVYGAFCTGAYSYIWNSGYSFVDNRVPKASFKYNIISNSGAMTTATVDNFRVLRVMDSNRAVCKVAAGAANKNYLADNKNLNLRNNVFDITCESVENKPVELCAAIDEAPEDILRGGEDNLALYDLTVARPASSGNSNNMFYTASFILGTLQGGINVRAQGDYCKTPEDYANASIEAFDYCAINKFNFAAQATGG